MPDEGPLYLYTDPRNLDYSPTGGKQAAVAANDSRTSTLTADTQVNLIGGMVNPTVSETKPNSGGRRVDAFLLRKLGRVETRLAKLEAAQ